MKFKIKIIVHVIVLMFVAFVISGIFNSSLLTSEIATLRKEQIENTFFNYLNKINNITEKMQANALAVSRAGESIYEMNIQHQSNSPEIVLENYLKSSLSHFKDILGTGLWYEPYKFGNQKKYMGVYAFWKNDSALITWEYNTKEYNYPYQGWYTIAIPFNCNKSQKREHEIYITSPYLDKLGDKRVVFITMSGLMYDRNNHILGVSSTDWSLDVIESILNKFYITENSYTFLIDQKSGNILYHIDTSHLMKSYKNFEWSKNLNIESLNKNKINVINDYKSKNNEYDIYYSINNVGFVFGIAINRSEAYSVVTKVNTQNIVIISVTLLIAAFILFLMISRIMIPLGELTEVVKEFAKQNFDIKVKIIKNDEVGELAKTFNSMAESISAYTKTIEEYNKELEKKVIERTKEISEKNEVLKMQKEELQIQSDLLETANQELIKLSIVACETDNAILIMNASGDIEWMNHAANKMYGFTLEEFIKARGKNIIQASSNPNINDYINQCINTKESITYESFTLSKNNEKIWAQTTITPILNFKNKVEKLVAIDSNITKLKKAEAAISTQRDLLEETNRSIQASIIYAQSIQSAILPDINELNKYFDTFVIFRPKDIVSGDFYWFSQLPAKENLTEKFFYAVVDCTGHGVPGAFMSLIGNRLLNEIINEKKILHPSTIIEKLNENIYHVLKQEQTNNNDGMDLSLIRIEKAGPDSFTVIFAGAKQIAYYYSQETDYIQSFKGARYSLGGVLKHNSSSQIIQKEISLKKNDMIYLCSDGIIDQNNQERKRFGSIKLVELFKQIKSLPTDEQKLKITQAINIYMSTEDQRDDITIMGIKL